MTKIALGPILDLSNRPSKMQQVGAYNNVENRSQSSDVNRDKKETSNE